MPGTAWDPYDPALTHDFRSRKPGRRPYRPEHQTHEVAARDLAIAKGLAVLGALMLLAGLGTCLVSWLITDSTEGALAGCGHASALLGAASLYLAQRFHRSSIGGLG